MLTGTDPQALRDAAAAVRGACRGVETLALDLAQGRPCRASRSRAPRPDGRHLVICRHHHAATS